MTPGTGAPADVPARDGGETGTNDANKAGGQHKLHDRSLLPPGDPAPVLTKFSALELNGTVSFRENQ